MGKLFFKKDKIRNIFLIFENIFLRCFGYNVLNRWILRFDQKIKNLEIILIYTVFRFIFHSAFRLFDLALWNSWYRIILIDCLKNRPLNQTLISRYISLFFLKFRSFKNSKVFNFWKTSLAAAWVLELTRFICK